MRLFIIAARVAAQHFTSGRLDDLQKQFPNVKRWIIDDLSKHDPSGTNKYVKWMLQSIIDDKLDIDKWPGVENVVQDFIKHRSKLTYKDIYKYELDELRDELSRIKPSRKEQKSGAKKVYSEGGWEVIRIDSRDAAKNYGSGTQWCINTKQEPHDPRSGKENIDWWSRNRLDGLVFYMIIYKPSGFKWMYAPEVWDSSNVRIWDARDNEISEEELLENFEETPEGAPDLEAMKTAINNDLSTDEAQSPVYSEIERIETLTNEAYPEDLAE